MTRLFSFLDQLMLSRAIAFQIAAAFLLLVFGPGQAADAQTRPQPVPVVLSNVRLLSESADESRFELRSIRPRQASRRSPASRPSRRSGSRSPAADRTRSSRRE